MRKSDSTHKSKSDAQSHTLVTLLHGVFVGKVLCILTSFCLSQNVCSILPHCGGLYEGSEYCQAKNSWFMCVYNTLCIPIHIDDHVRGQAGPVNLNFCLPELIIARPNDRWMGHDIA